MHVLRRSAGRAAADCLRSRAPGNGHVCGFRANPAGDSDVKAATVPGRRRPPLPTRRRPPGGHRRKGGRHGSEGWPASGRNERREGLRRHGILFPADEGREMPARRLSMRKVQEVLRLLLVCGLSQRQVSRVCGVARASVTDYVARARRAGLLETPWEGWSEEDLERRLYPSARRPMVQRERPAVDWAQIHEELKLKGVTLSLVWQEYRERQQEASQYSRFCELYAAWRGKLDLCMRQVHRPGEKLFVDYCG